MFHLFKIGFSRPACNSAFSRQLSQRRIDGTTERIQHAITHTRPDPVSAPQPARAPGRRCWAILACRSCAAATGTRQMREFSEDIAARAERNGRDPRKVKIIWGAQPLVAETESEARSRQA